jgi:hypothetical protein
MHLEQEADPFELVFGWWTRSTRGGVVGGGKGGMGAEEDVGRGCCFAEGRGEERREASTGATGGG